MSERLQSECCYSDIADLPQGLTCVKCGTVQARSTRDSHPVGGEEEEWLRKIEKRANAATAGPWQQTRDGKQGVKLWGANSHLLFRVAHDWTDSRIAPESPVAQWELDVAFVQDARTDIPRLLAHIRSLRSSLATVSKDKERLDWLVANGARIGTGEHDLVRGGRVYWVILPNDIGPAATSPRAAIDAAMTLAARRAPRPEETGEK